MIFQKPWTVHDCWVKCIKVAPMERSTFFRKCLKQSQSKKCPYPLSLRFTLHVYKANSLKPYTTHIDIYFCMAYQGHVMHNIARSRTQVCTGYSLNIVFFLVIFLNSVCSAAVLVFDLALCTHTDTEGKPRMARDRNIF